MCGLVGYIESKDGSICSNDIDRAIEESAVTLTLLSSRLSPKFVYKSLSSISIARHKNRIPMLFKDVP